MTLPRELQQYKIAARLNGEPCSPLHETSSSCPQGAIHFRELRLALSLLASSVRTIHATITFVDDSQSTRLSA